MALTGFEKYDTKTLETVAANLRRGLLATIDRAAEHGIHHQRKPGAGTPAAIFGFQRALLENVESVLTSREEAPCT